MAKEAPELVKITFADGTVKFFPKHTTLLEMSKEFQQNHRSPIVAAKVDNDLKELRFPVDQDCKVVFLDLTNEEGMKIYRHSLCFVLIRAASELFPGCTVTLEHSLSKGLYGEIHYERPITENDIKAIEQRMHQLIEEDIPFIRKRMPKEEAAQLFLKEGYPDKVRLLRYRKNPTVNVYSCGWLHNYFYGYMVPSTGYLKVFKLKFYLPGFILQFPETENPSIIPEYVEQQKLANIFRESEKWAQILQVGDVAALNGYIERGEIGEIIRIAEALHEKKIAQIADLITANKDTRLILIAGPSSSGKTTFAQRLLIQLKVNGLRPVTISLDDYFVNRENTPKDEQGNYDFEAIEAIDVQLFNAHLIKLIQGEEVEIPFYNFLTGKREYRGRKLKITSEQPIIVEGIHGLNEKLTASIPKHHKFKIYISALTQLNIDNHNRIPTTDARIIRRIVRDNQFRGHNALKTIRQWPSVRRGEERNIFPFQEEADIMFNSALVYELAALKKYAEPLLKEIDQSQPEYSEAKRLLKFLSYFLSIGDEEIPPNSILREFIGQSCFYQQ